MTKIGDIFHKFGSCLHAYIHVQCAFSPKNEETAVLVKQKLELLLHTYIHRYVHTHIQTYVLIRNFHCLNLEHLAQRAGYMYVEPGPSR
jgi:hypothetical protein